MERFNTYISTFDRALQQTPEILHAVRMDVPINVRLGMVNDLVSVVGPKPVIGQMLIRSSGAPVYERAF